MPTTSRTSSGSTSTPSTSTSSLASDLKAKLEASPSATVYVPLEEGSDAPTDDELEALIADGLHAELDAVRNALAVRAATEDEMAQAAAAAEAAASSTTSSTASASTSSSSTV